MTELQESKLLRRAVRSRWPIPDEEIEKTIERICYLRDFGEKEATQIAASNALIQMASQNQKDEHKFAELRFQQRDSELDAIAAELGIDPITIEAVASQASLGDSSAEAIEQSRAN